MYNPTSIEPMPIAASIQDARRHAIHARFDALRAHTLQLVSRLSPEDMVVQSMPDASPVKWHLAHTTWFFETFVLVPHLPEYTPFDPGFAHAFNSYYVAVGSRHPRHARGILTRPPLERIVNYRTYVDRAIGVLLASRVQKVVGRLIELGMAHEEQHQELLLMDILHLLSESPFDTAFDPTLPPGPSGRRGRFVSVEAGLVSVGYRGCAFAFDNESPRHRRWLEPFELSDRLVTNGEWLEFMVDGGYSRAELWLSDGWERLRDGEWTAPFYWVQRNGRWFQYTLGGTVPIDPGASVRHVSYFEADAYARWAGARLPTEAEWELAASTESVEQIADTAWQWTASSYEPYPGFESATGALGEYNGKFMSGQMVLRGGAGETPAGHARLTYRNFYRPEQRWMFSGVRLARTPKPTPVEPPDESVLRFAADVVAGLSSPQKQLSPKYFYDAAGSMLFERICLTVDYYPTRTETVVLGRVVEALAANTSAGTVLVEYGSGASDKTRMMLDGVGGITTYVPIDISRDALLQAAGSLREDYPHLAIYPVEGDFTQTLLLPLSGHAGVLGFFPGSTIGNFEHADAIAFLSAAREQLGANARFIVGVDLIKDVAVMQRAYDDQDGVTADFNCNVLVRMNRELGGRFDLDRFEHVAVWNPTHARIEMHLRATVRHEVQVAGHVFTFAAGETIHTENSHKFTIESFSALAAQAGWHVVAVWASDEPAFAVIELQPDTRAWS